MTTSFLHLTSANGNELLVGVHAIESIEADTVGEGSVITTPNGATYAVKQDFDHIRAMVDSMTLSWMDLR